MSKLFNSQEIFTLVNDASCGVDNIQDGAIGSSGYGFLFMNEDSLPECVRFCGGGRLYPLGSMKDFAIEYEKHVIKDFSNFSGDELFYQDIKIIGSVKTLVPDARFGDPDNQDIMFEVWLFVRTPDKRTFPARIYYGPTRLAIGKWNFYRVCDSKAAIEFESLFNYDPSKFSLIEKQELAIAIELALMKVPVSDFLGILNHDCGYRVLSIYRGRSIVLHLPPAADIDFLLSFYNYRLIDNKIKIKE